MDHHGFLWFDILPGIGHGVVPTHILGLSFVAIVLIGLTLVARVQLARASQSAEGALIPPSKLNYRNFFEIAAESLYKLAESVLGPHETPRYYPMIGCVFMLIFTCNLLGAVPGFLPPTDNINTTVAFGLFVFLYYNWVGFKAHGVGYLKHFMGPSIWLAPLLFFIELVSHFFRPLTLGLRLRTNVMADHMVLGAFSEISPAILPLPFMAFGLFVCFIQAFVFTLLTMVYISLANSHDH